MRINFNLNDKNNTEITVFKNIKNNPFKKDDIINLIVLDLHPVQMEDKTIDEKENIIFNNSLKKKLFNYKKIKLENEIKTLTFNYLNEPEIFINYYCKILNE
jgi:hypothetical protein